MKEKQYDPARHNEDAPAEGMASVNTHNPEEQKAVPQTGNQSMPDENILATKTENDKNISSNSPTKH